MRSLSLMPMPAHVQQSSGQLVVDPSFTVAISGNTDARVRGIVSRFLVTLRAQTGMTELDMKLVDGTTGNLVIHTDHASKPLPELGEDESYTLEVTPSGAKLNAATNLGTLRGLATYLQLVEVSPTGFAAPAVSIQDSPRFPWRGLMIDSARHFTPLDVIKRNLDGMVAVKMNVFHWHLSENQGFRVESKVFPKLHQMGSDGLFYTQAEIRDLIAYAADRGIRVVPEFDMPGHSTAWFVGHPELASGSGPYQIERQWGVFDPAMDITKESTYVFLDKFIGEMARLFPDAYFHVGGDEVNGKEWDANTKIQDFKKSHNIKTNEELQAYFNTRIQKIVSKHGKIMMGWDEVLQPGVPKDILIQSWRGQKSLADAAKGGYRGILSSGYYIDLIQPASQHYAVDPMTGPTAGLSDEEKKRILGGETTMWSEFVGPETIDSRIWPRSAAIAERFWSPQEVTDVNSMYERMEKVSRKLDWLGLTHNTSYWSMLRRMAGNDDIAPLKTLTDVVEPLKGYQRPAHAATSPLSTDPLNRLVDTARPESMAARHFAAMVNSFLSGKIFPGSEARLRTQLSAWRDNQLNLQPTADKSSLVNEAMPVSQDLSALGAAGLEALDYLARGVKASEEWKTRQMAAIEAAKKPKAQVMLMVVPSVQNLIEAASGAALSKPTSATDSSE